MKAYNLHGINELVYEEVPFPECPYGWCIVKVKAFGICSSDIPRIFKNGTYNFPTIPGHEFSGIVVKVGDEDYNNLIGKRVGIFPLIPCKKCAQCSSGFYEMCTSYDYIGSRRDGAFSEYVAVPIWNLIVFPDIIEFEKIATMEPLSVALHAIKQSNLRVGQDVAILGTGMIGFATAQWAKIFGAGKVTIIGRSSNKKNLSKKIEGLSYLTIDMLDKKEYDVVVEAVGSNNAINNAIKIVKPSGTLVLMGNPEGKIEFQQEIYWKILRKQINIIGTWNSRYENNKSCDWEYVKQAIIDKSIDPEKFISHKFKFNELQRALNLMKNHEEPYCKVMVLI